MSSNRRAAMCTSFVAVLVLAGAAPLIAQERAVTASGKTVLLYPDGTWKAVASTVDSALKAVNRPAVSTDSVEFAHGQAALFFDPAKWKVTKTEGNRTNLTHSTDEGFALIIAERVQFTIEALRNVAMINAKNAAPDAQLISERHRQVNGVDVLVLEIHGTLQSIPFVYFGYYYVGKEGSFQIITFTAANLFDEYRRDFEDLLNGFVLTP